ncbi:hypothetical protein JND44_14875, partial [Listeria monocytogenes]
GVVHAQGAAPVADPTAATAAPLPAEAFATLPFLQAPALSPDGTRGALRMAIKGEQRFAIIRRDGASNPVMINPGPNDLNSWAWVN